MMLKIYYAVIHSPLGYLLLAATEKGLCRVRFGANQKKLEAGLKQEFWAAEFLKRDRKFQKWAQALTNYVAGEKPWPLLPYDLRATQFQKRVWELLRNIPSGETYSYSEAAKAVGVPKAARAVARACAANPVALVIPCHRIVPQAGGEGGYRWGFERKRKLIELEKNHK